jgi:hypothetical protein
MPVVYLAGSGHTGSTLLALFADAHPRIVSVGETSFKRKIQRRGSRRQILCTCGVSHLECPFWQEVFRGVNQAGFEFGALEWSNDFRYKNPLAHRLLSRYSASPGRRILQAAAGLFVPSHRTRIERVRRVNVAFIRTVLRVANADVFFDTSKKAVRLHHLMQTPELDVKVIKLVRDVRGYVSSAKKRGQSVEDAAHSWRHVQETVDSVTRQLPPDRLMTLRYEDVCRDPRTWLKRVYAFCAVDAIDPPDVVVSQDHHVLGNNLRRREKIEIRLDESWRSLLDGAEQQRAVAIAGSLHERFGYAAP